ncbi:MAG: hypothetical protein AAF449_17550, partial [Myxococcota bacterium]
NWLTYEFTDRQKAQATLALRWENIEVPMSIKVDNIESLYLAKIRNELRSSAAFNNSSWQQAANYCLRNKINLEEGLKWAEYAVNGPFIGVKNFVNLRTLGDLQTANGQKEKGLATVNEALRHSSATPIQVHQYGRQLLATQDKQRALRVFQINAQQHPDAWPVHVGLARGYSAVGSYKKALKHAQKALKQAPDPVNKANLEKMVSTLRAGKPVS